MIKFLFRRALVRRTFRGARKPGALWGALMAQRILRSWFHDQPEVVWRGTLSEGETLVIADGDQEPRVFSA